MITGLRSINTNKHAPMTTAAEYNVNMSANITSVKYVKLPVHVSDTEAGVTTIRIAYTNHVVVQLL
jgi:hypothetical protein